MIKKSDYNNIVGIEFLDIDSNFDINDSFTIEEQIDVLAKEFKEGLNVIGIKFMMNEDDLRFNHLRGHYASALKLKLTNNRPEDDENFLILKQMKNGLEKYYYTYMVVPKLINEVYKKFFIDHSNKYTYNFQDGEDDYKLDTQNSEFSFINWESRISEAINPDKEDFLNDNELKKIFEESGFNDLFKKNWIDDYNNRLGIIFNKLGMVEAEEGYKIIQRFKDII